MTSQPTRRGTIPRRISLVAMVPFLLAAAACSDDSESPTRPSITRPLDASSFRDHACELLSAADAARLSYPAQGRESNERGGNVDPPRQFTCYRWPPESRYLVVDLYLGEDRLAYEYSNSKGSFLDTGEPMREPLTIADQPAMIIGRSHKQPERSSDPCDVVVGLTDTQSVQISAGVEEVDGVADNTGGRSCQLAIAVADAIVRNLASQN